MNVAELKRQVEYKFAPEPLLLVQALANTFAFEPDEERLLDVESTRRWLVESELAVPGIDVTERDRDELIDLRATDPRPARGEPQRRAARGDPG